MNVTQDSVVRSRVDKTTKKEVEKIIQGLGLNMSDAIRIYLNQIILTNGLPFDIKLPSSGELSEDLSRVKNK